MNTIEILINACKGYNSIYYQCLQTNIFIIYISNNKGSNNNKKKQFSENTNKKISISNLQLVFLTVNLKFKHGCKLFIIIFRLYFGRRGIKGEEI